MQQQLNVAGIVINGVAIALSALTSLDWRSTDKIQRDFATTLARVPHRHDGSGNVVVKAEEVALLGANGVVFGTGEG